jgi:hypothetical protein
MLLACHSYRLTPLTVDHRARNETAAVPRKTLVRMHLMVHTLSCLVLAAVQAHHNQTLRHRDPHSNVKA